jgi:hypothetical protein
MNDEDISQFMDAFNDFMKHAQVQEMYHLGKQKYLEYEKYSKKIIQNEIERKAARLNVSVEYYVSEFM